ncbi:forkhead box protein M1 isoform X7 [Pipistrellus kuhlii]|uniref:Forkhead box protein M1 n=1 Tax=Pipistrellus kuhlii TaxID=59472 RepID=A0A7J7ZI30_PIPKU|nr:forkhead box protein M1 isoform X7 [Pipistrellus kuhlii]KAF6373685.1 forkhead box M1 [Pipistrellus kuhlii]
MKTSPHRPLILKRRRPPLPVQNAPGETSEGEPKRPSVQQEPGDAQVSNEVAESTSCKFPVGIKIINHPTMPNTQVVAIPNNANIQSIITALTAKGKESGSNGPNKFILISCGGAPTHPPEPQPEAQTSNDSKRTEGITKTLGPKPAASDVNLPRPPGALLGQRWENCAGGEAAGCTLNTSLTNIQWLGKMSSDGLGSCSIKQEMEGKENQHLEPSRVKVEEPPRGSTSWQDSVSERPPYSYMAMIQFAINSTERKRMTLKDIYTWIEDHFPYFKHMAKPGWKNSIRHNLSLHDMFVRETSANGKVSFWTIHPSANRYLTLDQVFKPLDPGSPQSPEHLESQQKRPNPELRRNVTIKTALPLGARRKMKPLLPRVSSYLVPIRFPVSQPLVLQPSVKVPLPLAASLMSSELARHRKRVRIAPKVPLADEGVAPLPTAGPVKEEKLLLGEGLSPLLPVQSIKEEETQPGEEMPHLARPIKVESPPLIEWPSPCPSVKEELSQSWEEDSPHSPTPRSKKSYSGLRSPTRCVSEMLVIKRREGREMSRSRRKQHLLPPCVDEPELLFSEAPGTSRPATELPLPSEPSVPAPQLGYSQEEGGPFKTPVKEMLPISSTPSKSVLPLSPESWRLTPPAKVGGLEFSPVRTPERAFGPLADSLGLPDFSTTPLKSIPLFDSPQELLNSEPFDLNSDPFSSCPLSDMEVPKPGYPMVGEPQVASLPANRSLTEGLVLDTMNDSLSKILLDISFPGLEEDLLGPDNINWAQLMPELR